MNRINHPTLMLGLLAMAVCSGCQTFGTTTVRGQSPSAQSYGMEVGSRRTLYHTPIRSAAAGIQDHYHEKHNTDTYYFGDGPLAHAGHHQSCPPANCPPAYTSNCPPNGAYGNCPPEYCPPGHGKCNHGLCQDRLSYGYEVPNDLVYPPAIGAAGAGGIGGAVVYPYYTFKGPSDFFRQ